VEGIAAELVTRGTCQYNKIDTIVRSGRTRPAVKKYEESRRMARRQKYAATNANLLAHGLEPTMRLLIAVALDGSVITYAELGKKLEEEGSFSTIFTTRVGFVVGTLMERIQDVEPRAPLINVLVVNQKDRQPSRGAGRFLAKRFGEPRLAKDDAKTRHPQLWESTFKRAAGEVYTLTAEDWAEIFARTFGKPLGARAIDRERQQRKVGTETDGILEGRKYGRGGEGPEHKALRLWVKGNPGRLDKSFAGATSETEVDLDSGDRVDVVYKLPDRIVVLEVKSRISNEIDLNRGAFQCIKYRAVRAAMDVRPQAQVEAILVTEGELPERIANLLSLHDVRHIRVPLKRHDRTTERR
jgi:hypothetical protein